MHTNNNSEFLRTKPTFISSPTNLFPSHSLSMELPSPKMLSPFESFLSDAYKDFSMLEQLNPTSGADLKYQAEEDFTIQSLIANMIHTERQDEFEADPFASFTGTKEQSEAFNLIFSDLDRESMSTNSKTILSKSSHSIDMEKVTQTVTLASSSTKKEGKKSAAPSSKKEKVATIAGLPAADVDISRTWSSVYADPLFDIQVKICTKTRKDEPSELFPDKVYASLKYEIIEEATGTSLKDCKFLHSRAFVVYSDTFQQVEKTNTVKHVLKGVAENALTKSSSTDKFEGKLKIQIDNNLSTHSSKREYCVEIHFYHSEDLEKPVLTMRSPKFKAYARRPNKPTKRSSSERAAAEEDSEEDELEDSETLPSSKKSKSDYDQFVEKLEDLLALKNRLNNEDQLRASSLLLQQFPLLDQLFR